MKREFNIIITSLLILVISGYIFRVLNSAYFPWLDKDISNLIKKLLGTLLIIIYITKLSMWKNIGNKTKLSLNSILLLLPVIVFSLIPVFNGLNVKNYNYVFVFIGICLLIGINEELIFRGIIISVLKHRGKKAAIIISSVIFGLFHLVNLIYGAEILDTIVQVIFAFGFGLVMACIRYESGLILPQILVHALWDFTIKISNTDFLPILDNIHSISLALVVVWGVFLVLKGSNSHVENKPYHQS